MTKMILSNSNSLQISFYPKHLLNNFSLILSAQSQFSYQRVQLTDSFNLVKFPSTDLYVISLIINGNEIETFKINVTTQNHNLFDSFFDCKNISNSIRCQISNVCLSSKGLSFFGYENNVRMKNLSFIIDPMKPPEMLNMFAENNFNDHSFSSELAIYADLQSHFTSYFHLVTETIYPFVGLFNELDVLNSSKVVVLKRKPRTVLQYFPILNAKVTYLNDKKCYQKLIIGFPKYNGYYDYRFKHYLDPALYNYNYRRMWRSVHENYFIQNKNDKKINLLLLNRPPSCHRSLLNYDKIISAIKSKYPNWNIVITDFTNISLNEQIKLTLKADIFMTIHGAAEVYMLLLNDNALTIEIMPYLLDSFNQLYEDMANMTKLNYFVLHASKNSSIPKSKRMRSEYERNPESACNGVFRRNLRNQNIILNETEIDLLLKIIKNHVQYLINTLSFSKKKKKKKKKKNMNAIL